MGEFYQQLEAEVAERSLDLAYVGPTPVRKELDELVPKIQAELTKLRGICDGDIKANQEPPLTEQELKRFPTACCGYIVPWMFGALQYLKEEPCQFEGLETIVNLLRQGHLFKRGYGIMDSGYFQNALQLGHLFLNVANDTASDFTQPVSICSIQSADFKHITDMHLYLQVVESYVNLKVYPNNIFPSLAFANPYIVEDRNNVLWFMERHKPFLLWTETQNGFRQTQEFLFASQYTTRTPSEKQKADLIGKVQSRAEELLAQPSCCESCRNNIQVFSKPHSPVEFASVFASLVAHRSALPREEQEKFDSCFLNTAQRILYPLETE